MTWASGVVVIGLVFDKVATGPFAAIPIVDMQEDARKVDLTLGTRE